MIKKYRKLRGYTQEELAELLDMSVRQIQRIDNCNSGMTIETLQSLAIVLNIPDKEVGEFVRKYAPNKLKIKK